MKFTILSHAGLCVEHAGVRLVCDPWLIGSCYWRSWWNFPEPPLSLVSGLKPDFVYLTHLHWDHFHGPSLQKLFPPETHFLVPKVPTRRMLDDLNWLGFSRITEIPHGTSFRLGEDFTLQSYQFGVAVDSAALIRAGGRTIFNANDCKHFGLPLQQILRDHPKIDFVLRSHSSASPLPYCVEGHADAFTGYRTRQDYIEEFARFSLHIGARYAIPFASNHCFLHRDTFHFNDTAVSPEEVRASYERIAARAGIRSDCMVMAPGSSWSEERGFELEPFDYSERERHIEVLRQRHAVTLDRQYDLERNTLADFDAFQAYFIQFSACVPWMIRRWLAPGFVFRTRDARGVHNWLVNVDARTVTAVAECPADCVVIETPALILNDCTRNRMFSAWGPSKRLRVHLPTAAHLKTALNLFSLLDLYEIDTLPLAKNFSLRALGVRLRRWREVAEAGRLVLKHKVLRRPFELASLYAVPADASRGSSA